MTHNSDSGKQKMRLRTIFFNLRFFLPDKVFAGRNMLLEHYQAHPILFICIVFLLADFVLCYIIAEISMKAYTCPFCGAPFSFFVTDRFETNVHIYNQTEYRNETRGNRDVRVPYLVAYKNYVLHTVKECSVCGKAGETTKNQTDKM